MRGGQTFEVDEAKDFVRVVGHGMWTPADARAHFRALDEALRAFRSENRRVVFLLDMRNAVVQSRETAMAMHTGAMRMQRSTDIVAVVTSSILHAMQIKSVSKVSALATFHEMDEAMIWLAAQRCHA